MATHTRTPNGKELFHVLPMSDTGVPLQNRFAAIQAATDYNRVIGYVTGRDDIEFIVHSSVLLGSTMVETFTYDGSFRLSGTQLSVP